MQNGPQARPADLVHTHSGERVYKVCSNPLLICRFTFSRGYNMAKTVFAGS